MCIIIIFLLTWGGGATMDGPPLCSTISMTICFCLQSTGENKVRWSLAEKSIVPVSKLVLKGLKRISTLLPYWQKIYFLFVISVCPHSHNITLQKYLNIAAYFVRLNVNEDRLGAAEEGTESTTPGKQHHIQSVQRLPMYSIWSLNLQK